VAERRHLLAPEPLSAPALPARQTHILRLEDVAPHPEELRQPHPVDPHAHGILSSLMILTCLCSGIH
jgi:hypothetical protein